MKIKRLESRESRRQLEQYRRQLALGESQQQFAVETQQQFGFSGGQHGVEQSAESVFTDALRVSKLHPDFQTGIEKISIKQKRLCEGLVAKAKVVAQPPNLPHRQLKSRVAAFCKPI